jgi:hypothetical protein
MPPLKPVARMKILLKKEAQLGLAFGLRER